MIILTEVLRNITWGTFYDKKKGEIHYLLKKFAEKEDNNEKTKSFIFDILTQINYLNIDVSSIDGIKIKKINLEDEKNFQKTVKLPTYLLRNK